MKNIFTVAISLLSLISFGQQKETEIIVIGSIHQPVPNFNSDTLYNILEQINPDLILMEMDSSFISRDFKFKFPSKENEQNATERYLKVNPKTEIRPFDFEGRNEYRKEIGSRPTDNLATNYLDSLYQKGLLSQEENEIIKKYNSLTEELKVFAAKSPKHFNNAHTDSIAGLRQFFQYKRLNEIISQRIEFEQEFAKKPNGEKISYRDGYELASQFWDLRNRTMAKNIMKIADQNLGSRIVVLTGFLHRYYILEELNRLKNGRDVGIKEFYEY